MSDAITIPTTDEFPDYEQSTNLGDATYVLRFTWNTRDESWYITISDAAENVILAGQRIRTNLDILAQFGHAELPKGAIVAVNLRGDYSEPGRYDLAENGWPVVFVQ